jgi:hypothetical protein
LIRVGDQAAGRIAKFFDAVIGISAREQAIQIVVSHAGADAFGIDGVSGSIEDVEIVNLEFAFDLFVGGRAALPHSSKPWRTLERIEEVTGN